MARPKCSGGANSVDEFDILPLWIAIGLSVLVFWAAVAKFGLSFLNGF